MRTNEISELAARGSKPRASVAMSSRYAGTGKACFVVSVLAVLLLADASPTAAQSEFRLAGVSVVGSKLFDSPEVARATGLKVGNNLTSDSLKEAASKLASLGVFAQVNYHYATRGDTMTVVFTVEDTARLLPCTFGNFVWFSPPELLEGLRSRVPLFNGHVPAGGSMLDLISAALVAMLEARNIHAQVQFVPQGSIGGPVQGMQFQVVGVPMPVRKFEFPGAQKVDPTSLEEAAGPLLNKDYDAPFIRDFSRGGVAAVYHRRGYLRADFGDPIPHLLPQDSAPNAVAVSIPVSEGEQYILKEVAWSGDSVIPFDQLAKSLHVAAGTPMNIVQLEQDTLSLLLQFHPKGYLMADVKPEAILDDSSHTGVYHIQIRQGDVFRLGKLEIVGLDDARARSLVQLSRLRPGDPYDATYWSSYLQDVGRKLPSLAPGWIYGNPVQTIHADTKTVDVRLTFHPTGSK
jgi:outer membrane protein assembly factor BamA